MKKQAKKKLAGVARDGFAKGKKARQARAAKSLAKVREAAKAEPVQKAIALPPPSEVKALDSEALALSNKAIKLVVSNSEQEQGAVAFGSNLKALEKKITEFWTRIITPVKGLYDELREQRDEHLLPVTEAMNLVRSKVSDYYKERDRLEAEEAARLNKEREARALKEAKKEAMDLIAKGKLEAAAQLLREAKGTITEVIPERAVASTGAQRRETRDIEVFDEKLVPDKYWEINYVTLRNDVLGRNGIKPVKVPGVRIIGKAGVAFRAAAEA